MSSCGTQGYPKFTAGSVLIGSQKSDASGVRSPTGSGDSIKNKAGMKSLVDSTPWERIVLYCLRFGLHGGTFHTAGLLIVGFPFHLENDGVLLSPPLALSF